MIVTLLTDFGASDYFVAAMKGVILSLAPSAMLVDITHEIPPHDIQAAAFQLLCVYKSFPAGTVHVAIVDPGVGSSRRAIAIHADDQFFVGPDNGIFSYVLDRVREFRAVQLTNRSYFRNEVSPTFHGRDVFAPVAAAIASGVDFVCLGDEIRDLVRLDSIEPRRRPDGTIESSILYIDHFGNCITSVTRDHLEPDATNHLRIEVGDHALTSVRTHYAEESESSDVVFAVFGSAGFLELVARNASAVALLRVKRGDRVLVSYPSETSEV